MWRDPLDELIEALEESLPAQPADTFLSASLMIRWTDVLLFGTPEEIQEFDASPDGRRVATHWARMGRRRDKTT